MAIETSFTIDLNALDSTKWQNISIMISFNFKDCKNQSLQIKISESRKDLRRWPGFDLITFSENSKFCLEKFT